MAETRENFRIVFANTGEAVAYAQNSVRIGRLDSCEITLDHSTVSRIHAGITLQDKKFIVANLSTSNIITLNGRLLPPQADDILAGGDTIQIGPFTIAVTIDSGIATLTVNRAVTGADVAGEKAAAKKPESVSGDVLKVFWEKRNREKEEWGTRLRPAEKPVPGKAMYNWRPTRDLRRSWRMGVFVWATLVLGAAGVYAFLKYPQAYAPKPLANPHAQPIEGSEIANMANSNSCTTCHSPNEPMENSCIACHQASQFHPTNTKAHEDAGITCTVCHKEHHGPEFRSNITAIRMCAECHNDANKQTYNGKSVGTPHGGTYGYPTQNGQWIWQGVYREVADAIPELLRPATGDKDEQAKLSRYFHTIHVARLEVPAGLKGDKRGLVSCSTCHNTFDPIDRETPRQTCAACHTTREGDPTRDTRFGVNTSNCISCHVQHPYSGRRWQEFLTDEALERRRKAVARILAPETLEPKPSPTPEPEPEQ
ncbi:MAG: FHA domain-containing protein [Acidobacteriota bacterium]|nr:MAG: FHA domain-containing protein [Acidobacteriota bacterium]